MFAQRCPRCQSARVQRGFNPSPLALRLVGVYELLCNNCSLEFKGVALPGLVRRAPANGKDHGRRRQQGPRHKVRLPLAVSVIEGNIHSNDVNYTTPVTGQTRDLSRVGVAFTVPTIHVGAYRLSDPMRRLWVQIALPTGPINMYVAPVRHEQIARKLDTSWLIGARITRISEVERNLLTDYLTNYL